MLSGSHDVESLVQLVEKRTESVDAPPIARGELMLLLVEDGMHPRDAEELIIEAMMEGRIYEPRPDEFYAI